MPAPPATLPTAIPGDANAAVKAEGTVLKSDERADGTKLPPWSVENGKLLSAETSDSSNETLGIALAEASVEPPTAAPSTPVAFLHLVERLKTTPREGWRRFKISPGESISDHMYRMAIITMLAPPSLASKLDLNRCTKMALVHDMGEALVGDITPVDGVSKEEKSRRETLSMDFLLGTMLGGTAAGVPGTGAAQQLREIWQEYEDSETPESQFVHDVDKLELILQMVEYERRYEGQIDLGEFAWVAKKVTTPEVKDWVMELLTERESFWDGQGKGNQSQNWDMREKLSQVLGTGKQVDQLVEQEKGHKEA
jgi:putative hydrolase of HD superfamily